jgi:hypothetical protein
MKRELFELNTVANRNKKNFRREAKSYDGEKAWSSINHPKLSVPEFIDLILAKTSPKRSFSMTENERFGLVFAKTGSIISGRSVPRIFFFNIHFLYSKREHRRKVALSKKFRFYCHCYL